MMKKIATLGLVAALLICSGFISKAFVGSDGILPTAAHTHDFSVCKRADAGYEVDRGVCIYEYGRDEKGNPIYKDDCRLTDKYQWCNYICRICNKVNDTQNAHSHYVKTVHSVVHP